MFDLRRYIPQNSGQFFTYCEERNGRRTYLESVGGRSVLDSESETRHQRSSQSSFLGFGDGFLSELQMKSRQSSRIGKGKKKKKRAYETELFPGNVVLVLPRGIGSTSQLLL